ncbi:hypothetical protein PILCRDRAFT_825588 [Piloderma croceum F 1598]|uniref:Uncharacterized protein n=1 Tax=Piloderma croceum (strain F 1598) TaxID=765440 RepID=A0A0C3BIR2_PILCF|nr:hypothetical protein PILCRDRAFT_825588 [Piloderma croceum F 1598]
MRGMRSSFFQYAAHVPPVIRQIKGRYILSRMPQPLSNVINKYIGVTYHPRLKDEFLPCEASAQSQIAIKNILGAVPLLSRLSSRTLVSPFLES